MSILIDTATLAAWLGESGLCLFDLRYSLQDAGQGRELYDNSHISGARYVDLCDDLSGSIVGGITGRHPLPDVDTFVATLQRLGVSNDGKSRVVLYDDGSHFFVPRMWWMLSVWLGYRNVHILHGGFRSWQEQGLPVTTAVPDSCAMGDFEPLLDLQHSKAVISAEQIPDFATAGGLLLDARSGERFRGDVEPIDGRAGHIPGAQSLPCALTTGEQGFFLESATLRALFAATEQQDTVFYCGSGISACQSILAMVLAGLEPARLYPGSWSEWITDPQRPVAIGREIS